MLQRLRSRSRLSFLPKSRRNEGGGTRARFSIVSCLPVRGFWVFSNWIARIGQKAASSCLRFSLLLEKCQGKLAENFYLVALAGDKSFRRCRSLGGRLFVRLQHLKRCTTLPLSTGIHRGLEQAEKSQTKKQISLASSRTLLALEPRVVFDASAGAGADAAVDQVAACQADRAFEGDKKQLSDHAETSRTLENIGDDKADQLQEHLPTFKESDSLAVDTIAAGEEEASEPLNEISTLDIPVSSREEVGEAFAALCCEFGLGLDQPQEELPEGEPYLVKDDLCRDKAVWLDDGAVRPSPYGLGGQDYVLPSKTPSSFDSIGGSNVLAEESPLDDGEPLETETISARDAVLEGLLAPQMPAFQVVDVSPGNRQHVHAYCAGDLRGEKISVSYLVDPQQVDGTLLPIKVGETLTFKSGTAVTLKPGNSFDVVLPRDLSQDSFNYLLTDGATLLSVASVQLIASSQEDSC